jgi:hypothetical protein
MEFISRNDLEDELELSKLREKRDQAKLERYRLNIRVLWIASGVSLAVNLLFAFGAVRHMRLWH